MSFARHLPAPDYTRPVLEVQPEQRERLLGILAELYGRAGALACYPELERQMKVYSAHKTPQLLTAEQGFDPTQRFSEKDAVLITYGDLLLQPGKRPLEALAEFVDRVTHGCISAIHLLPFFPYSSDRGFSVVDFQEVDPRLGSWEDIERLGQSYRLMFDGVFNHISSKSRWFQRFLNGRPGFENYFVTFSTREEISPDHLRLILRPRTSELLTPFHTLHGVKWVWTTFSPDQVDLNFRNPEVLLRVIEVLLLYVRRGADLLRLDAVTYLWRELGTRCAHLKETHALVRLLRAVLDVVAPRVALVTETNVPHEDNITYFGDGWNEAQMVYNFALPPLTLYAFVAGDARPLSRWAAELAPPSAATTFFNFLDSHDGIGLLGARGILSAAEITLLVEHVERHGGLVSYRTGEDGRESAYELNVTWYSALNSEETDESLELQVARFVASRSIALVLRGVPGIYLPSLFGSKNDLEAVRAGEGARAINRDTLDVPVLKRLLRDHRTWVSKVARGFLRLLRIRVRRAEFHPNSPQRVLELDPRVFCVLRGSSETGSLILALANVSAERVVVCCLPEVLGGARGQWKDLLSTYTTSATLDGLFVSLEPYGVCWLARTRRRPNVASSG